MSNSAQPIFTNVRFLNLGHETFEASLVYHVQLATAHLISKGLQKNFELTGSKPSKKRSRLGVIHKGYPIIRALLL